jgi:regulatory protein
MPSTAPTSKVKNSKATPAVPTDPWPTALRMLTRRDYSQKELRQRLTDKGFEQARIEAALQRCVELGYLNDARYALNRATSLMIQGRAVGSRILIDLRQRGVSEEIAIQALTEARNIYDEELLLTALLKRRFPDFDYSAAPVKERRRVVHFLQRRGFTLVRIMAQLTRKGFEEHDENR